ncbi:MAG: hypothetical protein WCB95_09870 [Aeromicrobium sp.]
MTLATVVAGLVLTALTWAVVESPDERRQIAAADAAAAKFRVQLYRFMAGAVSLVADQYDEDVDDYRALLKVVNTQLEAVPRIDEKGTTAYGRRQSDDYNAAKRRDAFVTKPLRDLSSHLERRAIPDAAFAAAAHKLIRLDPAKLLGPGPVFNGAPLLDKVVPAYRKARKRLARQEAPEGAELLQADLLTYADDVIDMSKNGAAKIDVGEPFYFQLADRQAGLNKRVVAVESIMQIEVGDEVDFLARNSDFTGS